MNDTIDIEITPEVIAEAHPASPSRCYIALVLKVQFPDEDVSVGMRCAYLNSVSYEIPQPLRSQIDKDIASVGGASWQHLDEGESAVVPGKYTLTRVTKEREDELFEEGEL